MMNHAHPTARPGRSRTPLAAAATAALVLLPLGATAVAAQDDDATSAAPVRANTPQLTEKDHERLAKDIAAWYEARRESEGVLDAREDLDKNIEKIAKKAEVDDLLALSADWEAALRLVKEYPSTPSNGKGRVDEVEFDGFYGDEIHYLIHGPKSYRRDTPLPLMIIVPDAQQKVAEMFRDEWLEEATGIEEEFLLVATHMPEDLEQWTIKGETGKPGGVDRILQVFKHVTDDWNVDAERVFLCGMEDGVAAAVRVAALYPDRFAGVLGVSGEPLEGETVENFANLPLHLVAGADNATALTRQAEERGWDHVKFSPSASSAEMADWLRAQRRTAHPAEVHYHPHETYARDAYWLRVVGADPETETRVHAVADRATNTITIEGTGATGVVVFYSDRVVDLDRPVTVVIGGVKHEHTVQRNLEFLLERARVSGDPGRAYVENRPFDFPETVEGEDETAGE